MNTLNTEELLALAKECEADVDGVVHTILFQSFEDFLAFASALRQQDLARMARMREALKAHDAWHKEYDDFDGYPKSELQTLTELSLSETSDIQEWLDGQRAIVPDAERFFPFEFEVWQHDEMVASTSGPRDDALREAMHYAAQYEQDGPVRIFEVNRWLIEPPSARSTKE